jgi:hypothetical protein
MAQLVPDISASLDRVFGGIAAGARGRAVRDEQEAKLQQQQQIRGQTDIIASGVGGKREESALLRLSALNPQAGNAMRQALERGDDQELSAANAEAEKGFKEATFLQNQKTFAGKRNALTSLGRAEAAREGGDPSRILKLLDLPEEQLNTEIQRMLTMGADIKTLTETFQVSPGESVITRSGQLIGRAPQEITPTTDIGKARQDLRSGFITEDDFKKINKAPPEFKTSIGKLLGDKQAAISSFGEGSEQVKAIQSAIDSESKGEAPKLTEVAGVRKEFTKLSGDFLKLRDSIKKVRSGGEDVSAAGDLALIFNFMKILDPGSVVRESEFATAANTAGVPERTRALYNRVLRGERLSEVQRKDFVDTANNLFEGQKQSQIDLEDSFKNLAKSQRMNPDDVVLDFVGDFRGGTTPPKTTTGNDTATIGRFKVKEK